MILDLRSAAIFATLVGLILAVTVLVAHAQNAPTYTSRPVDWFDRDGNHVRYYRTRHRKHAYERRQEVRGWHSQARGYYPSEERCKGFLTAVGDQYVSEQGAKAEADKQFSATVRWTFGERFLDRSNAEDVTYECGRSSIGSVAGQIFHRCRIRARPCRPQPQREDK
jgi:hypothetical protein